MAVCKDKSRGKWYITFKVSNPDGTRRTVNIKKSEWSFKGEGKVSLAYMKSIEGQEIDAWYKKQRFASRRGEDIALGELCESYFKSLEVAKRAKATIYMQRLIAKNYLYKAMKEDAPVSKCFAPEQIEAYKAGIAEKGISPSSTNQKYIFLRSLIEYGRRIKKVDPDVAMDAVDLLQNVPENNVREERKNYFYDPANDAKAFFATFAEKDREWLIAFQCMLYGGFRISEFLALKYESFDFDGCSVLVRAQIDHSGKEIPMTKGKAARKVVLPPWLIEKLKSHAESQSLSNGDYMFQGKSGNPISHTNFRRVMNIHLEMAKLPHITSHGLRHTCASMLIEAGVPVVAVQKQLGHSSMQTTMQYYVHDTKAEAEAMFAKIGSPIF